MLKFFAVVVCALAVSVAQGQPKPVVYKSFVLSNSNHSQQTCEPDTRSMKDVAADWMKRYKEQRYVCYDVDNVSGVVAVVCGRNKNESAIVTAYDDPETCDNVLKKYTAQGIEKALQSKGQ